MEIPKRFLRTNDCIRVALTPSAGLPTNPWGLLTIMACRSEACSRWSGILLKYGRGYIKWLAWPCFLTREMYGQMPVISLLAVSDFHRESACGTIHPLALSGLIL